MKRRSWGLYVGGLALLLMLVLIIRGLLAGPSTAPRQQDLVAAERTSTAAGPHDERVVVPRDGFIGGNAVVEPRDRETKVAAPVPGRIAVIAVREGDKVSRGTLLVQLEDAPEQAARRRLTKSRRPSDRRTATTDPLKRRRPAVGRW